MSFKEILNYNLIKSENFNISVYHLFIVIVIIIVTRLVLYLINRVIKKQGIIKNVDPGKAHAFYQLLQYIFWITAIILILDTIGMQITFLLAGSAALLVGLGLGLQQIFKDIISGFFLLFEGTIKVGDVVEVDGLIGIVKEVGFRTSKVETRDSYIIVIPNSTIIEKKVINWSMNEKRTRFRVDVGVAYGSDVELVTKVLLESANVHKDISKVPRPFVRFNNFGDSALEFQLYFWTDTSFTVENTKSDLRYLIDKKFRENGITIPFPQRDVHIKNS